MKAETIRAILFGLLVLVAFAAGIVWGVGYQWSADRHQYKENVARQEQAADSAKTTWALKRGGWYIADADSFLNISDLNIRLIIVEAEVKSFKKHILAEWNQKHKAYPSKMDLVMKQIMDRNHKKLMKALADTTTMRIDKCWEIIKENQ